MAAIATTEPKEVARLDKAVGAPSSLTEPSALASHRLTAGDATSESAGTAEAGGSVVVVDGTVVVVLGAVVVVALVVVVVLRDTRFVVVGTVTPRCLWTTGRVVVGDVVDAEGSAVAGEATVVVDDAGTVVVLDDVEVDVEVDDDVEVDPDGDGDSTICALAADGAKTASIAAAVVVSPMVALSDHTNVRVSFWTI